MEKDCRGARGKPGDQQVMVGSDCVEAMGKEKGLGMIECGD